MTEDQKIPNRFHPRRVLAGYRDRATGVGGLRLHRAVPAGMLDASSASLASFAVTLHAARSLAPADLGTYALFYTAFIMTAVVPTHLFFSPAEIGSLAYPEPRRLRLLEQSLHRGLLLALGTAAIGILAAVLGAAGAPTGVVAPLALTSVACTAVSPVQDHVRRLLHFAGHSWRAAAVSTTQLIVALGCLVLFSKLHVPAVWAPFGALLGANIASLAFGLRLSASRRSFPALDRLAVLDLLRSGRWLLLVGLTPAAARFLGGVLVTHLASAATFGYVEAARVVSQPVYVLMMGLAAVFTPRLMKAGSDRAADLASRVGWPFKAMLIAGGLLYLLAVGFMWPFNPLPRVLPSAYVAEGAVPLMILALTLQGILHPARSELMGAGQAPALLRLEIVSSSLLCAAAATAHVTGVLALPAGAVMQGAVSLWLFERARLRIYAKG
jgi:O-antigen/teichoic acid export membrane protein